MKRNTFPVQCLPIRVLPRFMNDFASKFMYPFQCEIKGLLKKCMYYKYSVKNTKNTPL